jgi:putative aldouronate transport system substrate-binding protein
MRLKVTTGTGFTRSDSRTEKWLEERSNVDIEVLALPGAADRNAKITLLMADDKERPDVIWWSGMEADFVKWKDAGLLVDLTDWVDKYPEMRDYYESQDPRIMFYSASDGNRIFRIPGDVAEPGCEVLWIRKDWLDNLGLPIPKTMAEYEDTLYKFTFNDPDKNGKNDTYGFQGGNGDLRHFWPWIQGSGNGNGNLYLQFTKLPNGTLDYAMATEDAKKWLERVAKLYKDGVIAPNSIIANTNLADEWAKGMFGSTYRWVAWNNPSSANVRSFKAAFPNGEYLAIDVPVGDNGHPQDDPGYLSAWCFFGITKNAADPERVYAIWDDMAKPDPYITKRFGIEGQEWVRNADGTVTILSTADMNQDQNIGYDLFHDLFARKDFCNISNIPATVALFEKVTKNSRDAYSMGVEKKNPADYKAWLDYGSEITDVRDAFAWGVIGGTRSINEWDKYIADLKKAGLEEVLKELRELYPKQEKEMNDYLAARAARR